jgi:flavin reductase (DIM6/NTAB) family NADH-FMN oxidoreductase RutF
MKKRLLEVNRVVPCSVVLLSVSAKGERDAMTAAAMFVSENPPLFVVSVAKHILSHDLIETAGEFVLNVASRNQLKLVMQLGSTHGREVNKFKQFNISTGKASKVKSPLIKGSCAYIECRVITSFSAGNYTVYLSEALHHQVDDTQVPLAWYGNRYFALGEEIHEL